VKVGGRKQEAWMDFVLSLPRHERVEHMACVVGQDEAAIRAVRSKAPARSDGRKPLGFAGLFTQWHGRPPRDDEWPVPRRRASGGFSWTLPERTLLASLVGQHGLVDLAKILTSRLRQITGQANAARSPVSVQNQLSRLGLEASDVVGGLTIQQAGVEIGSLQVVRGAVDRGDLPVGRVGRLLVIPYKAWSAWKASRRPAPPGYVVLASIKGPLGIRSDKLPEFAKLGYIPTAVLCHPDPGRGQHSGKRGVWYIDPEVAKQLVADRKAGRPMPWQGKPLLGNLKITWNLWQERQHPASCETCAAIWGLEGAPADFDSYVSRYAPLAHGAKRHLTRVWSPGLDLQDIVRQSKRSLAHVARAIENGQLCTRIEGGRKYASQSDVTLWIERGSPAGDRTNDWLALTTASERYGFMMADLQAMIATGQLASRIVPAGPDRGGLQVPWKQVANLRDATGFTEEEAAAKARVSIEEFRELLEGVNWRGTKGIPLVTVQAVIKRLQSHQGLTPAEAAKQVGRSITWVNARIADGTVRVYRTAWSTRLYFTDIGLKNLQAAASIPRKNLATPKGWMNKSEAAIFAGVSITTMLRWCDEQLVTTWVMSHGTWIEPGSLKAQARRYWANSRFVRDRRPAWLKAEA